MNHCLACGRGIEDSATVCAPCEQWASQSVASSVPDAAAAAEPQNLSLFDTARHAVTPLTSAPFEAPSYHALTDAAGPLDSTECLELPFHAAPDDAAPYKASSYQAASDDTASYEATPYDAVPHTAVPDEMAPYDAAPYDAAPYDAAPYDAAPYGAVSDAAVPGNAAPHPTELYAAAAEAEDTSVPLAALPHAAAEPRSSAPEAKPASGRGLDRRILMMGGLAVAVVTVITLVMMPARGGTPAEVSAAPAAAPAAARARKPVTRPAKASIAGTLAPSNAGQQWSTTNRGYWVGKRAGSPAFELPAENSVAVWMNQVRPTLIVRCIAKTPEVFVVTESALKIEAQTTDHTVTYRFDEEPEFTDRWADSSEHDALFAPDGAAFALRLSRARTLRVGYTPHNAAPVVAQFQVSGLGALLEPVAKECGWKK